MRACYCPNCGASLNFGESNRDFGFCQYCGTKIMFDDFRSTHRYVDEARIKEAEIEKEIRLKEIELEEKADAHSRRGTKVALIIALVLFLGGFLFPGAGLFVSAIGLWIGLFAFIGRTERKEKYNNSKNKRAGLIKLTDYAVDYEKKNYKAVKEIYVSLGFKNVQTINLKDLITGFITKPGIVDEVTINGEEPESGEWYSPTDKVVITYHGLGKKLTDDDNWMIDL